MPLKGYLAAVLGLCLLVSAAVVAADEGLAEQVNAGEHLTARLSKGKLKLLVEE